MSNTAAQLANQPPLRVVHAELHRCSRAFADALPRWIVEYTNTDPPALKILLVCEKLWDPAFNR